MLDIVHITCEFPSTFKIINGGITLSFYLQNFSAMDLVNLLHVERIASFYGMALAAGLMGPGDHT